MKPKSDSNFSLKFKITKKYLLISIVYNPKFLLAIFFGIIFSLAIIFIPNILSTQTNNNQLTTQENNQNYIPAGIQIPAIDLSMDIKQATVSGNTWEIFDNEVSWLNNSGNLLEGNIVLYAHNKKTAFGKIIQMGIGNEVILKNNDTEKKYQVSQIFEATPKDIHLLENTNENKLTMYTCSGWFDAKRFFVIATQVK